MTDIRKLHKKWSENPAYQEAYEDLRPEFELASAVIAAREAAGLTQEELAERMKAKQPLIGRLESGAQNTTYKTLQRIAEATGTRLKISFESMDETVHRTVSAHIV